MPSPGAHVYHDLQAEINSTREPLKHRVVKMLLALAYRARREAFTVAGKPYSCFFHIYNATWRNERKIEVGYVRAVLERFPPESVLEVGNVMPHYGTYSHEVIDKYERGPRVTNIDVLEFMPAKRYDCIISISTLEHVGWDEEPHDPTKASRAVAHLRSLLSPGGMLIVTVPLNYNPSFDEYVNSLDAQYCTRQYLMRVDNTALPGFARRSPSINNEWVETDTSTAMQCLYGTPFLGANGLMIVEIRGVV